MSPAALPLLQGTLDLLVLGAIRPKPIHGYAIATAIDERSGGQLQVDDAALYQALHRLERQGCVEAEWGASENNRRARYYTLTPKGRRRLADQAAYWRSYSRALDGMLRGL
jgi:transcriptional regulator